MEESKLKALYTRLSQREKRLLVVWVITMTGLAIFVVSVLINSAVENRREGIAAYSRALELINTRQDDYILANKNNAIPIQERIESNELKLQTFLDAEAMRFDLKINNFKEQSLPVGGKRLKKGEKAAVVEESVTIEIEKADYKKFSQFVDKIHNAPELLVIKRIHVQKPRQRRSSVASDANPRDVRVSMTISTFKKGEG